MVTDGLHSIAVSTTTIRHIIAMPPNIAGGGESYFQGFSRGLFPDYLAILKALINFPHDALDPFIDCSRFVLARTVGSGLDAYMVRADLLGDSHLDLARPLNVVWSTSESVQFADAMLHRFSVRPIHITVGESENAVSISMLTEKTARDLVLDLLARAGAVDSALAQIAAEATKQAQTIRDAGELGFSARLHNCTAPLVDLLVVYGLQVDGSPIEPTDTNEEHVAGIAELVKVIDGIRHGLGQPSELRKNDAILFCPSIFAYLYRADSRHWNQLYRTLSREQRSFLKLALIRNRGYANVALKVATNEFNPYEDEVLGPLLTIRQYELRILTLMVSLAASNQFVPAIRFPNAVMLHHDRLRNIYGLVNSSRPNRLLELNRKVADYSRTICEEIGSELLDGAFSGRQKLLTVCDFPIEWLSVNLLPAMFRFEMSRIPSTPGNLMGHVLLSGQRVLIPLSVAADILILRSFAPRDPIRDHLSIAVSHFAESSGLENLRVQLIDVSSKAELIDAMNGFSGMTVVFDCHGNHGGETSHAWLQIGSDRVDVWGLASLARVPPIVILAACSTHAVDGSHASVANGMLRSGAISV